MRISQFYITLGVLPFHLSLSISINATLNRNSNFLKKKLKISISFENFQLFSAQNSIILRSPSARCNHLFHALPASDHGADHAPEPVRVIDKSWGDHHLARDAHGLGVSNDGLYFSQALPNGVAGLRTTGVSLSFQGRLETASKLV